MVTVKVSTATERWAAAVVAAEHTLNHVDDLHDDAMIETVTGYDGFVAATVYDEHGAQMGSVYPILGFMPDTGG